MNMLVPVSELGKFSPTVRTLKWLLAGVDSEVLLESWLVCKALNASFVFTLVWLFPRMRSSMVFRCVGMWKATITNITLVRFFSRMRAHVRLQAPCLSKRSLTNAARVWPFTSMNPHVNYEGWMASVCFRAETTLIRFNSFILWVKLTGCLFLGVSLVIGRLVSSSLGKIIPFGGCFF